jgi:hypothetical protein
VEELWPHFKTCTVSQSLQNSHLKIETRAERKEVGSVLDEVV